MFARSLSRVVECSILRCHGFHQGLENILNMSLTWHKELCWSHLQLWGFDNHRGTLMPENLA